MLRSTRVQMLLVLAAGALIGYAAASGKLNPFQRAEAAQPGGPTVVEKTVASQPAGSFGCCPEDATKAQLLAMSDPKVQTAVARAQAQGKKPNIVFIMADDIGWS